MSNQPLVCMSGPDDSDTERQDDWDRNNTEDEYSRDPYEDDDND